MTDERLLHVQAVLREALRHTGNARSAVLDRACAADPELRLDVEALVRRAGTHLDLLRPAAADTAVPETLEQGAAGDRR